MNEVESRQRLLQYLVLAPIRQQRAIRAQMWLTLELKRRELRAK